MFILHLGARQCVCVFKYVCVYVHVCIYICIYIHTHTCMHVFVNGPLNNKSLNCMGPLM